MTKPTSSSCSSSEIAMSSTMSFLEEQMREVANMMLVPPSPMTTTATFDHSLNSTMTTPTAIRGWEMNHENDKDSNPSDHHHQQQQKQ
jgi:hypothetical protein